MSLLTPPSSSHRSEKDKENFKFSISVPLAGSSTRTVVWASEHSIHSLATPIKNISISSKHRPSAAKSILKASSQNMSLLMVPVTKQRDVTPEPADPLINLKYLETPVEQILSNGLSEEDPLGELIEGYNVLAARLRATVSDATDADASWPLFQPLRKNSQALVDSIIRDLGRALVDPLSRRSVSSSQDNVTEGATFILPSPKSSPVKKKGGMTAEQVKYARDLCTACLSVIKLLAVVLSIPAIYNVFDEKQLGLILTAVLAIPLAEEVPTPNARKTCALAIWLIQVQRLPAEVLQPAADRIAYALQRGIDGELGKEGKKGSANDGMKAIHDLCVYLPAVFVPAFVTLLPSVLSNLLAATLALRTQACHALGGIVVGLTSIPLSTVHTRISNAVAAYLTTVSPSPNKKSSPTKPTDAAIVRTLKTTITNAEPLHVAQGPVWAISVLASMVVLLGSKLCSDQKVNRIASTLLSLGMRHQKSSVRALCCIAWRSITWVYFQPPLPVESDAESEIDDEIRERSQYAHQAHLKVMSSVVDCQAGVATIAALLGDESPERSNDDALRNSIAILQSMTAKSGCTCIDGLETIRHMVSSADDQRGVGGFDLGMLLPKGLFSANPGLLTTDFKNLSTAVRPMFDEMSVMEDVRCLTREEMSKEWVFKGLMEAWKTGLGYLELCDDAEVPENLVEPWTNLLQAKVGSLQENGNDMATRKFASLAVEYLVDIVQDPKLDLVPRKTEKLVAVPTSTKDGVPDSDETVPDLTGAITCSNGELRLRVVQRLWMSMMTIFPHATLGTAAENLLTCLVRTEEAVLPSNAKLLGLSSDDSDEGEQARNAWVALCLDLLSVCDIDAMRMFWGCEEDGMQIRTWVWSREFTCAVWRTCVEKWRDGERSWEGGVVLLGVPFTDRHTWGPGGEDIALWEEMLGYTTSKALDHGVETSSVLDGIASFVSCFQTPGVAPGTSTRLVDLLFSNLDAPEMRDLPLNVLELASETMKATYPPEPMNYQVSMWMVRSLAVVVEHCPLEFCLKLLQTIQEGLSLWLADESGAWLENDMTYDIIPLYQHILVKIQALPELLDTLEILAPIIDSVFRKRVPILAVEAFADYWKLSYSHMPTPEQGWPKPIHHCLLIAGIPPVDSMDIEEDNNTSSKAVPFSAFSLLPSSPRTPVSASFSTPSTAILKREAISKVPSPHRPMKLFGAFPVVPSTPVSPVRRRSRSSTGARTPLSAIQLCGSPSKRRRLVSRNGDRDLSLKEKENMVVGVVSVAERIAANGQKPADSKKRRIEDNEEDDIAGMVAPTPTKKLKSRMKPKVRPTPKNAKPKEPTPAPSTASSNESEDERWVEQTLGIAFPSMANSGEEQPSALAPRRQRENSATPEEPGRRLQHRTQPRVVSLDSQPHSTLPVKIDLRTIPLRRSTSIPEFISTAIQRKRKRAESDSDLYDRIISSDPPLCALPLRAAKRVYNLPLSDPDPSILTLSSDDDPHLGQVTPHHIISPALHRRPGQGGFGTLSSPKSVLSELFGNDLPGSDDSIPSPTSSSGSDVDSPTKQVVLRHLRRTGSDSGLTKMSFGVSN